jgi:hypothetical protein
VTSWPSLASIIAVASPTTLPPQMMTDDTGKPPSACRVHPILPSGAGAAGERARPAG